MRVSRVLMCAPLVAGCLAAPDETGPENDEATSAAESASSNGNNCDWPQWGGDPAHTGQACKGTASFDKVVSHMTFDPFVAEEKADAQIFDGRPILLSHFQTPLNVGDDVYMEFKAGEYTSCAEVPEGAPCGPLAWNTQIWTERKFHWRHGKLVHDWTFESDWKPVPGQFVGGWEPVFHAVVSGHYIYVPGASGAVHKLNRHTGHKLKTIRLPGVGTDPMVFVAGGLAADKHGNIYYNALSLDPANPFNPPRNSWLVKIRENDSVQTATFASIAVGAPAADAQCLGQFNQQQLPWPPAPDAVPPSFPCGPQRASINVTPAIGPDGTVVTVSRAHFNPRYSHVIAVNSNLSPKWTSSLRDFLNDGCGATVPINAPPGTTDPALIRNCRIGATPGVEPATNQRPAGMAIDIASSSPVILPDGGVVYGAFTGYNGFRGHTFKFDKHGQKVASYDFGWDLTPAVYRHDGTYSLIIKDNHYVDGLFDMTQLDANLNKEWSYRATNNQLCHREPDGTLVCADDPDHPTGFEWCVNAPAVDKDGNIYANNEDGWVYKIGQGGMLKDSTFLLESLGAAYTPISLDRKGRLYSLNGGDMFVLQAEHGHHNDD